MGSKSFPAAMSIEAEGNDNELPDFCKFFKKLHTLKEDKRVDQTYLCSATWGDGKSVRRGIGVWSLIDI